MKLIAVNTEEKYDALMCELEAKDYKWVSGYLATKRGAWGHCGENTVIHIKDNNTIAYAERCCYEQKYPDVHIIDYEINSKI